MPATIPDLKSRTWPILAVLFVLFALVRISSPLDLLEADQDKQLGYVMDLLTQGNLAIQYEVSGKIATKPPLYNWLAGALALILGSTAPWVMKLPSLLSAVGVVLIIFLLGRRFFGPEAGLLGALACLASFHFMRLAWIARTDMLMVFLLHLAIYLTLTLKKEPLRSLLVGFVVGACFLAKGPVGLLFFLAWLMVWGWYRQRLGDPRSYLRLLPGLAVALVIAGGWAALVWEAPGFQETVVGRELGRRVPLAAGMEDPIYLYFTWLLARIAPWPLIALAGLWLARTRLQRRAAFFLGMWALCWLVMLSLVGVKRADLILPVYPAVFILTGLGLDRLFHPRPGRAARAVCLVLAIVFMGLPLATPWLMNQPPTLIYWLLCGLSILAGLGALWLHRTRPALIALPLMAGLIVFHGLHHHGFSNHYPLLAYEQLQAFLDPVRSAAARGEVRAFEVHPLISYELGLHVPDKTPLEHPRPKWVIIRLEREGEFRECTGWPLTLEAELTRLKYGRTQVGLYRVGQKQPE